MLILAVNGLAVNSALQPLYGEKNLHTLYTEYVVSKSILDTSVLCPKVYRTLYEVSYPLSVPSEVGSCDVDCTIDDWGEWSPCSKACDGGIQVTESAGSACSYFLGSEVAMLAPPGCTVFRCRNFALPVHLRRFEPFQKHFIYSVSTRF